MTASLETLVIAAYVFATSLPIPRPGPAGEITDAELIALSVAPSDLLQHARRPGSRQSRVTDKKGLKLSPPNLDDLDRMRTQRGHCVVRYADDVTIYVASNRAAERDAEHLRAYRAMPKAPGQPGEVLGWLHLQVDFPGFGFLRHKR